VDRDQLQFYSLYVSRFAGGFGLSAFALTGVATFLAVLVRSHGAEALIEW